MPDSSSPVTEKPVETYPDKPYQPDIDKGGFIPGEIEPDKSMERKAMAVLFIVLLIGIVLFVGLKHRSVVKAQTNYDDIKWARDDWVPPKLELASFRKDGFVVTDLDEVEAGVLIGIPYDTILSMILFKMIDKGYLEEISINPLRVKQVKGLDLSDLPQYEKAYVCCCSRRGIQ